VSIGLEDRVRALEVQVAATKADLIGHVELCNGRWRVINRGVAGLAGLIALGVSVAVAVLTRH